MPQQRPLKPYRESSAPGSYPTTALPAKALNSLPPIYFRLQMIGLLGSKKFLMKSRKPLLNNRLTNLRH